MARYTGPRTKKARTFGEAIYGPDKYFERRKFPPGQHGAMRKRRQRSDYAVQLAEKQKAKYIYGVLERQFRATFERATAKHGVTGEWLLKLLESRLDNVVYRLGMARTRSGARQLVSHKHILVNGILSNSPSHLLRPGDVISVRGKSQNMGVIRDSVSARGSEARRFSWLELNLDKLEGRFIEYPTRDIIPEKINEQLIVELYSK
jgi:small subunit ribosomal protein S4